MCNKHTPKLLSTNIYNTEPKNFQKLRRKELKSSSSFDPRRKRLAKLQNTHQRLFKLTTATIHQEYHDNVDSSI